MNTSCPVNSSIGKKAIVTITGLLLLGFVIAHMIGNLQIFLGQPALNHYAHKLRSMPEILWVARIGLLAAFVLHVIFALCLARENKAARPIPYMYQSTVQASYASRVMVISGVLLILYVVYHLAHFTWGSVHSQYSGGTDPEGLYDVYSMVVRSFQSFPISAVYIAAMAVLCFHLSHAAAVFPQSLGFGTEKNMPLFRAIGFALAVILFIGYTAIPVGVLTHCIQLPNPVS